MRFPPVFYERNGFEMLISLKDLGLRCKQFRVSRGYYQYNVAEDTGYTTENISAFECGRNDNSRILLWYIAHGMTIDEIKGGVLNGKSL